MANIYNMTDTWTDGSTLTSIKMNVTDTSSAADSKLLDLQVGGSSKLTVGKDGAITAVQAGSVIPFYFANQAAFPSASTYHGAVAHSHNDGAMYFAHGGNWLKLVNANTNGKVGIGTASPTGLLELSAGTGDGTLNIVSTANVSNAGNKIAFFGANRSTTDEEMAYIQPLLVSNSGGAGNVQTGDLTFGTSGSERMRITSDGKVGIGTSSPGGPIDVVSNVNGVAQRIRARSADEYGLIEFVQNNGSTAHGYIGTPDSDTLAFFTNGLNERMRIDGSGKVSVLSGAVELNSNVVNGTAVLIADDAYATITPTGRYGGNLSITGGANGAFPNHRISWFGYVDFGNSALVQAINYGTPRSGATTDTGSLFDVSTNGQPSGTTGTDGNVTLYVGGTSGTFYLENRSGSQIQFQITLI